MKASEIIRSKLIDAGGVTMVRTYNGKERQIILSNDRKCFYCPQLIPYNFEIFDDIAALLLESSGYRASKGSARSAKLGEPGCEEDTVAGRVLLYMGKKLGESGLDPVFILAAMMDWAGIATNGRGYIGLTPDFVAQL